MSNKIFIPVEPMGAVRTTQKQKYVSKSYQRYAAYKKFIGLSVRKLIMIEKDIPIRVDVTFYMPKPKSWSQKKKNEYEGKPHIVKSDIDNLIKGFFDSLTGIAWYDDNQVFEVNSRKYYSDEPGIEFGIEFVD